MSVPEYEQTQMQVRAPARAPCDSVIYLFSANLTLCVLSQWPRVKAVRLEWGFLLRFIATPTSASDSTDTGARLVLNQG